MIRYRLRIADARAHLVEVEVTAEPDEAGALAFALPAWSPGSYLVRDYARNLRDLSATGEGGRALATARTDKQTVVIGRARAGEPVTLRYQVYAHELTVRTSHVDEDHAFLHGPSLYMYVVGRTREPVTLELEIPGGWEVATALEPDGAGRFRAEDYDALVDRPIELAKTLLRVHFEAAARPHELAICGRADGPFDPQALGADVARIVTATAAIFGGLPYDRYLFLLHLSATAPGGGLEHRDSTALLASSASFRPRKRYDELLELFAHEHFHAWNGKRIRPRALGPFDYTRENYTRSLWVVEGVTSYYDRHLLVRAGLMPARRYLEKLGEELARLRQVPGRLASSLEEASHDAWIKLYKPDESTPNATISYYLKGSLVALALDLEIRRRTDGARSLDDAMRLAWQRFGSTNVGYEDDAVQSLIEEATGLALGDFFDANVRGRAELALEPILAEAGLQVEEPASTGGDPGDREAAWLGALTREPGPGRIQVASALAGGPADRGGLYAGDEIVALDGFRVDERTLRDRLGARHAGERARLTIFRRDELREVEILLERRPPEALAIKPDPAAPAQARARYTAWLGEPFPDV
jgi:predicted metalloprotease with PDZ domain